MLRRLEVDSDEFEEFSLRRRAIMASGIKRDPTEKLARDQLTP